VTSQIERVADLEVRHRRPGFELSILSADQKKIDLTQPDKVVYQEGCASGRIAARKHLTLKQDPARVLFDLPNHYPTGRHCQNKNIRARLL
jgi:hypothetical protein